MYNFLIYDAINTKRKCWYVGYSTRGLEARKREHYKDCFQEKQPYKFYNFLRKYKWESFKWKVIKYYDTKAEMIQGEIDQIELYKKKYPNWECLNVGKGGIGGDNISNHPDKERIVREQSERMKYFLQTLEGKKWIKKQSVKRKCFLQTPEGDKWKEKQTEWWKQFLQTPEGDKWRNEHSEKMKKKMKGKMGFWAGKKHSEKAKRKMSKNHWDCSGLNHPRAREVILISPKGKEHHRFYYKDFCLEHNLNLGSICLVLQGKQKHHKGWTGRYL